jgi:multiple antibiotic resistance protein
MRRSGTPPCLIVSSMVQSRWNETSRRLPAGTRARYYAAVGMMPMKEFLLCFVPLFVAVDPIGALPVFLSVVQNVPQGRRRTVVLQSVITAAAVALGFLAAGSALLRMLGITVADFMVAGGVLLFGISMGDLLSFRRGEEGQDPECLGAVPIGVPLITGPAVLATTLLLSDQHGGWITSGALLVNIALAGLVFSFAARIHSFLGKAGSRTISKVASLILASVGVMMVRKGIYAFFHG